MTDSLRKGWCPSLLNPMESGDGLLVRVKPRAATISAAALAALTDAAGRYGNGLVDVTNRGNLQFRGFGQDGIAPFAEVVFAHCLAERDLGLEQIRNITVSPLGADDPTAAFDAHAVALAIDCMLAATPELKNLPPKFGFSVDGGGLLPLGDVGADILIRSSETGVALDLAGTGLGAECKVENATETIRKIALAFIELSRSCSEKPRRMRHLLEVVGADAILQKSGVEPAKFNKFKSIISTEYFMYNEYNTIKEGFIGVELPFGQCSVATLGRLAVLSSEYGDGTVRMTSWRALIVSGISKGSAEAFSREAARAGFITDTGDPRRSVVACPGMPACASASVTTHKDATLLAASGVLNGRSAHVSGCIKGCANPRPAAVTLAGCDGRYRLIHDGKPDGVPDLDGLTIDDAIAELGGAKRRATA